MTFKVKDGIAIAGSTFVDGSRNVQAGTIDASTATLTGELRGPASFVIDPSAVGDNTGTVIIRGNLQVDGSTTTINSTTLSVDDLNIVLADGAANAAAANGAGLTVAGSNATFTYTSSDDRWNLNKNLNVSTVFGALSGNATTASAWQTSRTLSLTGDVTGSVSFDGSSNFSITTVVADDSHAHTNYLPLSGGTLTGRTIVNTTGRAFTLGGSPGGTPNATIATQTSYLEIAAGAGGNTNSGGLIFHNPNVSTSVLEYVNTSADNAYFNFRSDDTTWNVRVNGNQVWHAGNLTNLNQLTNGPGYITGESDTLATVTARGSTTSSLVRINNQLQVGQNTNGTAYIDAYGGFAWFGRDSNSSGVRVDGSGNVRATAQFSTGSNARLGDGTSNPASTAFSHTIAGVGTNRVVNFDGNGNGTPSVWWTNGSRAYGAIDATDPGLTFWANNGSAWQKQITMNYGVVNVDTVLQQGGNQVLHAGNFGSYSVPLRTQSNWNDGTIIDDVIGLMAWKNYGNSHVIFDASNGTAPNGTSISNTNPQNNWTGSYPTLMGWNGSNTYGVRVDSSRVADSANSLNLSGHTISNSSWAGGSGYHGYQYNGGNYRFGFSSTGGVVDVYADGNFYATDSSHLVLHAGNYTSYSPSLTGSGASGTWGINITGNADTVDSRHASYFYPADTDNGYSAGDINGNTTHQRLWAPDTVQDMFAFNPPTTVEYSTNGSTWTSTSISSDVFSGKMNGQWGGFNANVGNNIGGWRFVRLTWQNFGYRFFSHFTLAHSTNGHSFNLVFYKSSLDGSTWTEAFRQNGISSWPGYTVTKHSNVSGWWDTRDIRIVFELNHNSSYPGNAINIGHIGLHGSYGGFNRLFDWNGSKAVTFNGNITAPILYDSNDTGYYSDPNSSSRLKNINVGNQGGLAGTTYAASFYHDTRYLMALRYSSGGSNYPWLVHDSNALILHFDSLGDRFVFNTSGSGSATGDFRAPIFYDSNDTSYYVDPNGSTAMRSNGVIIAGNQGFQSRFYAYGRNRIWSFADADAYGISYFQGGGGYGGSDSVGIHFGTTSADCNFIFRSNSDFIGKGNITAYSDIRLKTNITRIENALEKVCKLNGYTYDRTDIETSRQTGVIAQEVLEVLPEAVTGNENTNYSVAYGNMVGLLIEAIKEQQSEIDELKALVKQLLAK